MDAWSISCTPGGAGTRRQLLTGDLDVDWSDKSECTLIRVVGNLNVQTFSGPAQSILGDRYRFGLLVVEEVDDFTNWTTPDIFDPEVVEEFEWMWLREEVPDIYQYVPPSETPAEGFYGTIKVDIDTTVRRKLGKKDHLVLVGQMATTQPNSFNMANSATWMMRALLAS